MELHALPTVALRHQLSGHAANLLQSILSSVDYGVLLTGLDHTSLACNQRFGDLFGVDIEAVVESDSPQVREMARERIHDFDGWTANMEMVHADHEFVQTDELRLKSPTAFLRRYTGPVRDEQGNVIGRLWTFQDRTRERRLERMREYLHEASLAFDPDPKHVYELITNKVSEYFSSLTLLSIRAGEEGDYMEFRVVAGAPSTMPKLAGNVLNESFCQFTIQADEALLIQDSRLKPEAAEIMPTKVGLTRYAGVPLRAPDQSIIGTLCILDGKSDELIDEDDMRFLSLMAMRISSELEREKQLSGLERDLAATQSQLIQSEKLAVTGTLAASIAHDIRNILSAISLTITMGVDDPAETLDELHGHLDRFTVLSHRLLSYVRPQKLTREPVSLPEVLRRVLDLLASHFRVAMISLNLEIDSSIPDIAADPTRLDHLFVNLILNAIQASGAGKTLHVSAVREEERVVVRIRDEGPGMSQAAKEKLFKPFSTSRSQGFGLGLYSCRQIVMECGGKIDVVSAPGKGTTFQVEFEAA